MQNTRQRILDYLNQHGTASPRQLAQAFGMTPANLRRHVSILVSRGFVESNAVATAGRGRPQRSYALSASSQPNNLTALSSALLTETKGRGQEIKLKRIALNLIGDLEELSSNFTQRLVNATRKLSPLGYRPRWEARPSGPQLVLGLCPYAAIIVDHPELCRMDAHMLEHLLGSNVEQLTKLQPGPQGTLQCVFQTATK